MESRKHKFRRPCDDCGEMYTPTGTYSKYCPKHTKEREENRLIKMKEGKKRWDTIQSMKMQSA